MNAAPIAGLDLVQQLVAEAAQGRRGGWTLDSTHERGAADDRSRAARRRAVLLQQFGHETLDNWGDATCVDDVRRRLDPDAS